MKGKTKNKIEFIGWTSWDMAEHRVKKGEYKDAWDLNKKEYKEIRTFLVEYLLLNSRIVTKKHKLFTGHYHQNARNGVPVIKYNNDT